MEVFKLFGTIACKNDEANEAIDETTGKAEQSENKMSAAFKKIGAAVATYLAVDKIVSFGKSCVEAAADADAAKSQFTQVFGDLEGEASKSLSGIADDAGIMETRMKGSYTKIAAFAKTTGMDTESALQLANRSMVAIADSAAFYDRSLEETTESLQSFLKGNYENDAALGLSCTEVTRNEAANRLYGQSFKDLSEEQKQLTLLQMVEDANELSGAIGQAARESDTWTNQTGNLKQAWTDFKALIGSQFLDIAVQGVKGLSEIIQDLTAKMPEIIQWFKEHEGTIKAVATVLGALTAGVVAYKAAMAISGIISAVSGALNGMTIAQYALNLAMSLNPVALVVAAIAALIVVGIALYKNWDTVKEKALELWSKLTETFENIKNAISEKVEAIKNALSEKWEVIKTSLVETVISIKEGILEKWESIKTAVVEKVTSIKDGIIDIFNNVKETLAEVWDTIKNAVKVALMFISELIHTAFELITLPWRFIWENCKEYIFAAWEAIKTTVSAALDAIKTTISHVWNEIVEFLSPILNGIKDTFTRIWNAVKDVILSILIDIQVKIINVWENIKSIVSNVVDAIKTVVTSVFDNIKTTVSNIMDAVKTTISNAWDTIKSTVSSVLDAIKTTVSNIMDGIKTTISNVWDAIKTVVSNAIGKVKDTISGGLNTAKGVVSDTLDNIKNKFSSIFESAKNIVKNAIEKIKSFFHFEWSLPKIKMPHFSIKGGFSLNPPKIPSFSVDWYKKAMDNPMIMEKPTIFGVNPTTGQPMGGGEAGSEIVSGTNTLMGMIRAAVKNENSTIVDALQSVFEDIAFLANITVNMDGKPIANELVDATIKKISRSQLRLQKAGGL